MNRRTLFKLGVFSTMALGLFRIGFGPLLSTKKHGFEFLKAEDIALWEAIYPSLLGDDLYVKENLTGYVKAVDAVILSLPKAQQAELRQLHTLLSVNVLRKFATGIWTWEKADRKQIEIFLSNWKNSSLQAYRLGYLAFVGIGMGAFYGDPSSWEKIGYDGPPELDLETGSSN